jgi:hypothetical protein
MSSAAAASALSNMPESAAAEMKNELEIQRAHDLLTGFLLEEKLRQAVPIAVLNDLNTASDVLCWVLEHGHNQTFVDVMKQVESFVRTAGFEFRRVE